MEEEIVTLRLLKAWSLTAQNKLLCAQLEIITCHFHYNHCLEIFVEMVTIELVHSIYEVKGERNSQILGYFAWMSA